WAWVDTLAANYHAMRVLAYRLGDTTAVDLGDADPPQTVASSAASWGGARSRYGWHRFTVDLSDFVGETIALVFEQYVSNADDYMAHPGFYIDDVEVLELEEVKPAIIRTPYHDAFVNVEWTFVLEQSGGFIQPVWSIVGGLWVYTWGVGSSGGNLRVVSGSGSTVVETVEPAYRFAYGRNVWGGDHSRSGWMLVKADLSQWKGQTIQLEFGFRASSGLERPGIYIDDVIVMEE